MAGFLSDLARKENKEPASPRDLAQNVQLFVLLRSGIIAQRSESNNTGKSLRDLGICCTQSGMERDNENTRAQVRGTSAVRLSLRLRYASTI
jgi:hypothetical protein